MNLQETEGCEAVGQPCLLNKIKEAWLRAHFPIQPDKEIIAKAKKIMMDYHKEKKNLSRLSEEKKESLRVRWSDTLNIATRSWEQDINADRMTTAAEHRRKIGILMDYIGNGATR